MSKILNVFWRAKNKKIDFVYVIVDYILFIQVNWYFYATKIFNLKKKS